MALIKKYGFLLIPALYWLIYLGVRLTYNGLAGEYTPDFIQSIRHDGVFIICSLLVFYIACLRVDVSDGELSGCSFWLLFFFMLLHYLSRFLSVYGRGHCCRMLFLSGNWAPR
jgi:hypothetical protein